MNNLRSAVIIIFISSLLFMVCQQLYISVGLHQQFNIVSLELANIKEGPAILTRWLYEKEPLVTYAQLNTSVDFLFIFGYVGLLIIISYGLMQSQPNYYLNNGLRFCMLLAVLAGLLDVVENIILLLNMFNYNPDKVFITAMYVAYPKWILIGIIILSWMVSVASNLIPKNK